MAKKDPLIAAIDIGTNSFHLVIASIDHKGMLNILARDKDMVRLGSGFGDMKELLPDAIERGITALRNFSEIAKDYKADIRAIATSAVREAENQVEFLEKVKSETGIDIEVVSGSEEGRLIYLGALRALPIDNQKTLIIDIGGGSTETIVGRSGDVDFVHSVKLGAIRLTKRFFSDGPATKEKIRECREFIKGAWSNHLKRVLETGFETVVGTAGTIQNIAAISLAMQNKDIPEVLNGVTVERDAILAAIDEITSRPTAEERLAIPGIDPKRADIILAGALIIEHAIINLNIQRMLISAYSLREGIVYDTIKKNSTMREFRNLSHLRYETVYKLCRQYSVEMEHAEHVRDITLQLFDDLQSVHNLGFPERELLEAASILHDIGYFISRDQHHKHSYYLIRHSAMPGFTSTEQEMIANVARYHRKSHPKKKHENFNTLTTAKQHTVKILASLLRIAEGVDRRQLRVVKSVQARLTKNDVSILLCPASSETHPDIELWGAIRRKPMFEETFGKQVTFKIADE